MLHATFPPPSTRAMRLTLTRAISAAAVSALLLSGCGSTESVATSDTTVATEEAATGADSTAAPDLSSETTVSSEGTASETTVALAAPAGGVVLSDGQAPAERQIVLSSAGFSPATLTIKSGDTVTFTTTEGIYAVIVGTLDGATVTKSLVETFTFSAPGTYPVREDLSGATATIIVE